MSKVFAEIIRLRDRSLPPFSIALPHWLLEQHKQDEDEETLKGHKDGEDVSKGKELLNFYHQNSNDPSNSHHHSQRDGSLQPIPLHIMVLIYSNSISLNHPSKSLPNLLGFFFVLLSSVLVFILDNQGHYKETNVSQ